MIRKIKPAEYGEVTALWLKTSLEAHNFIEAAYWQKMSVTVARDYLPLSETYVFVDKHRIKGFISILENNYIGALFVAPEFQHQKIGSRLLAYIRRYRPTLNLKVFAENKSALRFYQKQGFKIVAEKIEESTRAKELQLSWAVGCISGFNKRFPADS